MVTTNNDTTLKTYKKLSIQVSLNGLSFLIRNNINTEIEQLENYTFEKKASIDTEISELISNKIINKNYLFDEVIVLHNNSLNTFVPKAMYDEKLTNEYLKNTLKTFPSDSFSADELPTYDCINVYVPYININNILVEKFGSFVYKNSQTILVSKLLDLSKNIESKQVFVHFNDNSFEIVVVQNQKLLFFNSFEYATEDDFLYYLLFTLEQLQLNPEKIEVYCLGTIHKNDAKFIAAYTFVRNFFMFDSAEMALKNNISEEEARKNFVIINV